MKLVKQFLFCKRLFNFNRHINLPWSVEVYVISYLAILLRLSNLMRNTGPVENIGFGSRVEQNDAISLASSDNPSKTYDRVHI